MLLPDTQGRVPDAVSVELGPSMPTHVPEGLMPAPRAAFAATEPQALPQKHAPKQASGAPVESSSRQLSAEMAEKCSRSSSGAMVAATRSSDTSTVAVEGTTKTAAVRVRGPSAAPARTGRPGILGGNTSKRPAPAKPLGTAQGSRHDVLAADSSNITTPTSTAPGAANVSATRGAAEKRGKVMVAKQAVAKRGATSAQKPKGKRRELITASEYAKMKNAEAEERRLSGRKTTAKQFLEGKRIFYYGGEMNYAGEDTQRKMDIVSGQNPLIEGHVCNGRFTTNRSLSTEGP